MTYEESNAYQYKQFDWFQHNRENVIKNHYGEYVLLHDGKVAGYYPDDDAAYHAARFMGLEDGSYLIQECVHKGEDAILLMPFGAKARDFAEYCC
jgi:hypothetical protein